MLKIGTRSIGIGSSPFIIAEMSGNHNQSLDRALSIVDAAADAGAHAIWFNKKCLVWNETTAMPVVIDDWEKGYIKIKKHYEF